MKIHQSQMLLTCNKLTQHVDVFNNAPFYSCNESERRRINSHHTSRKISDWKFSILFILYHFNTHSVYLLCLVAPRTWKKKVSVFRFPHVFGCSLYDTNMDKLEQVLTCQLHRVRSARGTRFISRVLGRSS